jgi:hypothetical protein
MVSQTNGADRIARYGPRSCLPALSVETLQHLKANDGEAPEVIRR